MSQLGHIFSWSDIPTVPQEYIIRVEIFSVNAELQRRNYFSYKVAIIRLFI
jgi:hypothetical protein